MDQSAITSRTVPSGNGLQWITDGFNLFKKNIGIWIALFVILFLGSLILMIIPIVGPLAITVINPILLGGLMLGCKALDEGQELQISHLFAGFQKNTVQLFLIGVFYLAAIIIVFGIVLVAAGGAVFASMSGQADPTAAGVTVLIGLLIGLALYVPILMALWFAPALVALDDMDALPALKQSFFACLKNIVPFLVYGIIALVIGLIAIIPLGLGLLVAIPVMMASMYTSYRDIFKAT